jgi:hypothetical protein
MVNIPGITDLFSGETVKEIFGGIDKLNTTAEERATIKANVIRDVLEVRKAELSAQSQIIVAEAQGKSWIQRNWRPLGMMVFITIVAYNYIIRDIVGMFYQNLPELDIPPNMWTLLTVGFGGYVVGRSAEKIATTTAGVNLFTKDKMDRRTNRALLRELKAARKRGDKETVNRILDMIDAEDD